MTRSELIQWAEAHASGPMVSPVAVAVLKLADQFDRVVDNAVDHWNANKDDQSSIFNYLGLTFQEYAAWVERS